MHKQLLAVCFLILTLVAISTSTAAQIPTWSSTFSYQNNTYTYRMIGSNPGAGSATIQVPVMIVPIDIYYPGLSAFKVDTPFCGVGTSGLTTITNSPLFQAYPFYAAPSPFGGGQTFVGNTQYVDAFQRANFWDKVSTVSPGYHVLFGPVNTYPPRNLNLLASDATVSYAQTSCGALPKLTLKDQSTIDNFIIGLLPALGTGSSTLNIFLVRNVAFNSGNLGGTHSTDGPNLPTYIKASIADPGIFQAPFQDVYMLAHELAEWVDDPYAPSNSTPTCAGMNILEVGDPVNGTGMSIFANGFTYSLPDLVFLAGFSRGTTPNPASGGYTFFGVNPNPC